LLGAGHHARVITLQLPEFFNKVPIDHEL